MVANNIVGENSFKHDVKTSFLIANAFNMLVGGLFPLSLSVGLVLTKGDTPLAVTAFLVGVPIAGLAAIGGLAAIKENRKVMNIYSVLAGLLVFAEALAVAFEVVPDILGIDDIAIANFFIFHGGITLIATALAYYLAKQFPHAESQTTPSTPLANCLKYFGYGLLVVFILGYFFKFF